MAEKRSSIRSDLLAWVSTSLRPEYVLLLALFSVQAYLVANSEGFHRIDEGADFIDNVRACKEPSISVGVWQRFGRVWLFALPAQVGHKAVKVFASLLFLGIIFVCYKVAELEKIRGKEWIVALVGFQPILLDISYTCFAELPAALLLILSYYYYRKSFWRTSLVLASSVFLFRFEMSIFALIVFVAAIRERKIPALPFVLFGPALWYAFSWFLRGDPVSLFNEFIEFSKFPKYAEGSTWTHYVGELPNIVGPVQVGLLIVLLVSDVLRKETKCLVLYGTAAFCLVINTLASSKALNWTGSVGDLRYIAPVAPFVGILALRGLSVVVDALRKMPLSAVIPAALSGMVVLSAVGGVKPHHLSLYEQGVMTLARTATADSTNVPILSNHWAATFAVLNIGNRMESVLSLTEEHVRKQKRAYILWDSQTANSPFSQQKLTLAEVRGDSSIALVDSVVVGHRVQYLFLKAPVSLR
ncbi:MAG: hypothetical protein WBD36_09095 [Bacteroidota bacterium]